ncbi:MAG: hypothetical protein A3J76_01350 [Candidatus Moranbacteria bacterium RBG_13_45_13]|nr:MAG: hypothetical protein A3J76_01350 [Candidatus Moranbacteria bacterium RBG_13_45_13]
MSISQNCQLRQGLVGLKYNQPKNMGLIWRKKYREALVFIGILGVILIFFSDYFLWYLNLDVENLTFSTKLSLSLYFVTFLVIFWYMRETYDLKIISNKILRETRKQTNLETRPYLKIRWDKKNRTVIVSNIGRGLARQIEFTFLPVDQLIPDEGDAYIKGLRCLHVSALARGESSNLVFYDSNNNLIDTRSDEAFSLSMFPENNTYKIEVTYTEVDRTKIHRGIFVADWRVEEKYLIENQE